MMDTIRFLADENFDGRILQRLRSQKPDLDVIRVQDTPLMSAADAQLLEWAARAGRVILTHDLKTMVPDAYACLDAGQPMAGLIAVPRNFPIGRAVEELLIVAECSSAAEWIDRVQYLPL